MSLASGGGGEEKSKCLSACTAAAFGEVSYRLDGIN